VEYMKGAEPMPRAERGKRATLQRAAIPEGSLGESLTLGPAQRPRDVTTCIPIRTAPAAGRRSNILRPTSNVGTPAHNARKSVLGVRSIMRHC